MPGAPNIKGRYVIVALLASLVCAGIGAEPEQQTRSLASELVGIVEMVPCATYPAHEGRFSAPRNTTKKALQALRHAREKLPVHYRDNLLFYEWQCLLEMGDKEAAFARIVDGLKKDVDVPRALFALTACQLPHGCGPGGHKCACQTTVETGRILPLSKWGWSRSRFLGPGDKKAKERLYHPTPFPVPNIDAQGVLLEIGRAYEREGMDRRAIDAYLSESHRWFSDPEDPRIWLRVGELELKSGRPELGLRAFLRVAWLENGPRKGALSGVSRCLRWTGPPPPRDPPVLHEETRLKIADLYAEYRAHPIALGILDEAPNPDDPDIVAKRKAVQESWQTIVEGMCSEERHGPNCYLFGVPAREVKDWTKTQILRPSDTFWRSEPRESEEND